MSERLQHKVLAHAFPLIFTTEICSQLSTTASCQLAGVDNSGGQKLILSSKN